MGGWGEREGEAMGEEGKNPTFCSRLEMLLFMCVFQTSCGDVLISVNPFKQLNIFDETVRLLATPLPVLALLSFDNF